MGRHGLAVLAPLRACGDCERSSSAAGWLCQFFAVYTAMRAFDIHAPLPAAGLVLLLMNVATFFPLWPGNIGLLQAAIALPLRTYGVACRQGDRLWLRLQAIEASVGVGVGLIFLAARGPVVRDAATNAGRLGGGGTVGGTEAAEEAPLDGARERARVTG